MSRWEETLDYQLDLWRFWGTERGKQVGKGFGDSMHRKDPLPGDDWTQDIPGLERQKLIRADTIYVAPEIMELLEAATGSFKPEEFLAEDLITPFGFLLLPRPIFSLDKHGKRLGYRALTWGPAMMEGGKKAGIHISWYSYVGDEDDFEIPPDPYHSLVLCHANVWWFNQKNWMDLPGGGMDQNRDFQVLMRLAQQTITVQSKIRPPRHARKRAERQDFRKDELVTVITLRRARSAKQDDEEEQTVEWTCRWIVKGFWRNQWYPSVQAHRQIWISDFVKGPADKPLRIKRHRAFEFVR